MYEKIGKQLPLKLKSAKRPVRGPGLGPGRAGLVLYVSWISWIYFCRLQLKRGLFSFFFFVLPNLHNFV